MRVQWTRVSRAAGIASALEQAEVDGLTVIAHRYRNEMLMALRPGGKGFVYKTTIGNVGHIVNGVRKPWYTGATLNHVTVSDVETDGSRKRVRVGTDILANLFWEVGHHNIFTRHFEHDPKWVPTFRRIRASLVAEYNRIVGAALASAGDGQKNVTKGGSR